MESEISSGTMLGIVLIALAAVIGIGFMVFSIAKGIANEGVVDLQDNLGQVSDSAFEDFDQKIVTGTQVMSAYKTFQGKPVAVLINTQASDKGVKSHADHTEMRILKIGETDYVNYNAILTADAAGTDPKKADNGNKTIKGTGTDAGLVLKDGIVNAGNGYAVDQATGKIVFDTNIGGLTKAGNGEYISSNAKFDANIIKDTSGITIGVVFTQLAK